MLDGGLRLPLSLKAGAFADTQPRGLPAESPDERRAALGAAGCRILATETHDGRIALPELLDDLAAQGIALARRGAGGRRQKLSG